MTASEEPTTVPASYLQRIRTAVREERPYLVGAPPEVRVKLNQNESPYDLPEALREELLEVLRGVPFNRYPEEQPRRLQQALAEYTGHDVRGILVGNGSNELTYTLGLTLIDPGAPVVLPTPMFSLYEKVVQLHEGTLHAVGPRPDLSFDAERLVKVVRAQDPVLTVLTSPNNPTGLAMPLAEIEAVLEVAEGFVVVDEAYVEFNTERSAQTLLPSHPNLIILRTLSKAFGLAGLRIGYLMAHPDVVTELMKARLPFMVGRFAEQVACTVLEHADLVHERVERIRTSCKQLTAALRALDGVDVLPSQANFVIFRPSTEPDLVQDRLAGSGVLVRNMGGYPELRGYLRVNAGTPEENKAFLAALEETLYNQA